MNCSQDDLNKIAAGQPIAEFDDPNIISPGFDDCNMTAGELSVQVQLLKIRVTELERMKNE